MKRRGIAYLTMALMLASCGGAADETTDESGGADTSGGETVENEGTTDSLDPCAESEAPCEGSAGTEDGGTGDEGATEGEAAGGEGEGAEGTTEGEGGAAEGEGQARGTEGGEEGPTPQQQWRAQVRLGRQWFNRRCDTCHPGGEEDIGPDIRRIHWPVARMRHQIRQGSGRMRPIPPSRLSNAQMEALMAYLSTMGTVRGVSRPE